jgi:ATP-dependent DNA ligase
MGSRIDDDCAALMPPTAPGFIPPCLPSKAEAPPTGPLWIHEIKHDGYRLMVRKDGPRVRCFTKNGHGWTDRFPAIVHAARRVHSRHHAGSRPLPAQRSACG